MSDRWGFFDNINEIVYVSDLENYELVYMNKKALEVYGINSLEEVRGRSCHQILRGSSSPCTFCSGFASEPGCFEERQYPDGERKAISSRNGVGHKRAGTAEEHGTERSKSGSHHQ